MAAHAGAHLLQRQEEGQEEGADRERHTGGNGGRLGRAVSEFPESRLGCNFLQEKVEQMTPLMQEGGKNLH